MKLYSYYRSTAAYRVRIALNLKELNYDIIPVNLVEGKQREASYLEHNPQGRVPTLVDGDFEFGQSMAMLEYLEEQYPTPALLPKDIKGRAWVRFFSQIIVSDIHPLNNTGPLKFLASSFGLSAEQTQQWYHQWLRLGFDALEKLLLANTQRKNFCFGDKVTFADICLIPQVYNAQRFEFSMEKYPLIQQINAHCLALPAFERAQPENQPDCMARSNKVIP